jgi:hypothetical protein
MKKWNPMIRSLPKILLAACLMAAGCMRVDPETERRSLLNADRAFASAALAGETDRVFSFWTGDYQVSVGSPDGRPTIRHGRYLQAWRKDEAGSWRCTLEIQAPLSQGGDPMFVRARRATDMMVLNSNTMHRMSDPLCRSKFRKCELLIKNSKLVNYGKRTVRSYYKQTN